MPREPSLSGLAALSYRLPGATWTLVFPLAVVQQLQSFRQKGLWARESAGQLYARDLTGEQITVVEATKLAPRLSSRYGVSLDLPAVTKERRAMFAAGYHCVGFWHSHPQDRPTPSPDDLALAKEHAQAGKPQFAGLVFAIVGRSPFPEGLGVWLHDGSQAWQAECER
jgi:hypothetical protein